MSATKNHYEITSDAKSTTIVLQPDIGNAAWGDIEQVGAELLSSVDEKSSSAWLVDLSKLDYMGSALVALLVRVWKAIQASGGKVVVVCGDGMPRDVIRLAGLDKVWTIATTTADGYKSLGVRAPVPASDGTASVQSAATAPAGDGFPILGVLSFVAALVAGGVLALVLGRVEIERNLSQLGMFGGAGIAVALGLLSFLRETSWGRGLGCVALLAGIAVGVVGYQHRPENTEGTPADTESDADDPREDQETEADNQSHETAGEPQQPATGSGDVDAASADETPENTDKVESASETDDANVAAPSDETSPAGASDDNASGSE